MNHNNETSVQDFIAEPGVFFLGIKSLNLKSVAAARNRDQVLPVVGRHLFRQIYAETCWNGGRIDHSRSWMNFSLLPDDPMTSEAMVVAARAAMLAGVHRILIYSPTSSGKTIVPADVLTEACEQVRASMNGAGNDCGDA